MTQGGVLQGRDSNVALEGSQHGSLYRSIAPGLDGNLEVGSQLPGGEDCLELVAWAFKGAGGRTSEEPIGTAHDLGNGGG